MRTFSALTLLAIVPLLGCGSKDPAGPEPGPPVVSTLSCSNGTGLQCELDLGDHTGFTVRLASTSCEAPGNTLRVTKPVAQTLTTNGCYEQANKAWEFNGPYTAPNNRVYFEVVSAKLQNNPVLRVSGTAPTWTLEFEDGGDTDYNDLVLTVTATP